MAEGTSFLLALCQGDNGQLVRFVPSVESKGSFVRRVLVELYPPIGLTPRYVFNCGLLLPYTTVTVEINESYSLPLMAVSIIVPFL